MSEVKGLSDKAKQISKQYIPDPLVFKILGWEVVGDTITQTGQICQGEFEWGGFCRKRIFRRKLRWHNLYSPPLHPLPEGKQDETDRSYHNPRYIASSEEIGKEAHCGDSCQPCLQPTQLNEEVPV